MVRYFFDTIISAMTMISHENRYWYISVLQVIQVIQVIQVMQVRLAHLWPDFRVIFLFSGLRDGRASPYQLNGGTKWVQYFFFDLRDDISYVQILYNAKWSYLCISDISAVLGNNNQKKIWFLDDNIWFDAVKLRKLKKKDRNF